MEYSRTLPPMAGGGGKAFRPPPPAICQTNGQILDPKMAFDSSGLELAEYVAKFYLNVTVDVTGRVKDLFLISVIARFAGQNSLIKLKLSQWNEMDRVLDTSKYLPSQAFCDLVSSQGHLRSRG